jgi:hypothetical protein
VRRRLVAGFALAVVVAGCWCLTTGRTTLEAWRVPVDYSADALYTLGTLRAAQDGHLTPVGRVTVPELGAPHEAGWNDFLRQHKLQYLLAGLLARGLGLFPTANLLVLLAGVLGALAFLAVSLYFRARLEWAVAGACAFALSPFFFHRSLSHLTLACSWPVPLAILVVAWAYGRRGLVWRTRRFRWALSIVVVVGLHNIYFAALFAQFLGFAWLGQWLVRRSPRAATGALVLLLALFAVVAADNAHLLLQRAALGPAAPLQRPYGNLERYALKPLELVLPMGDGAIVPWRAAGASYRRRALVRGEMGPGYLGLAGVAALVALAVVTVVATLRRPRRPVPLAALAVAWILAYSVVGGVNGLLGLSGFVWLRAASRNSIWILALVLLWGVLAISRTRLARRRAASVAGAVLVGALTLADQLPPRTSPAVIREVREHVASDASFARSLGAALPPGAMLFQLPVLDFPEGRQVLGASDYEHLRPYLHSRQLRFSYGSDKGRPREAWQRQVESLEPAAMARALERMGFAGIIANRKAYPDEGRELRDALAASGWLESWESPDRDFLFVRLRPDAAPASPEQVLVAVGASSGEQP